MKKSGSIQFVCKFIISGLFSNFDRSGVDRNGNKMALFVNKIVRIPLKMLKYCCLYLSVLYNHARQHVKAGAQICFCAKWLSTLLCLRYRWFQWSIMSRSNVHWCFLHQSSNQLKCLLRRINHRWHRSTVFLQDSRYKAYTCESFYIIW